MARKAAKKAKTKAKKRTKAKKTKTTKAAARKSSAKRATRPARKAKRAAPKKTAKKAARKPAKKASRTRNVKGEGSYTASRNFRKSEETFVRKNKGKIADMGKAAEAALEGPAGGDLQAAEDAARARGEGMDQPAG